MAVPAGAEVRPRGGMPSGLTGTPAATVCGSGRLGATFSWTWPAEECCCCLLLPSTAHHLLYFLFMYFYLGNYCSSTGCSPGKTIKLPLPLLTPWSQSFIPLRMWTWSRATQGLNTTVTSVCFVLFFFTPKLVTWRDWLVVCPTAALSS